MGIIMCPGFEAAGIAAGLKKKEKMDLGLIYSNVPANAAGVFTRNRVKAAPVILDKERIKKGVCQAMPIVVPGSGEFEMPKSWPHCPHQNSEFRKIWCLWLPQG